MILPTIHMNGTAASDLIEDLSRASSSHFQAIVEVQRAGPIPSTSAHRMSKDKTSVSACVPVQREMERGRSPLVSIPPVGRGFSRQPGLPIRCDFGPSAKGDFRAQRHRLDEPAKLSLGMVASPQSPLPFHLAEPL
jgi:hypothetical protein